MYWITAIDLYGIEGVTEGHFVSTILNIFFFMSGFTSFAKYKSSIFLLVAAWTPVYYVKATRQDTTMNIFHQSSKILRKYRLVKGAVPVKCVYHIMA